MNLPQNINRGSINVSDVKNHHGDLYIAGVMNIINNVVERDSNFDQFDNIFRIFVSHSNDAYAKFYTQLEACDMTSSFHPGFQITPSDFPQKSLTEIKQTWLLLSQSHGGIIFIDADEADYDTLIDLIVLACWMYYITREKYILLFPILDTNFLNILYDHPLFAPDSLLRTIFEACAVSNTEDLPKTIYETFVNLWPPILRTSRLMEYISYPFYEELRKKRTQRCLTQYIHLLKSIHDEKSPDVALSSELRQTDLILCLYDTEQLQNLMTELFNLPDGYHVNLEATIVRLMVLEFLYHGIAIADLESVRYWLRGLESRERRVIISFLKETWVNPLISSWILFIIKTRSVDPIRFQIKTDDEELVKSCLRMAYYQPDSQVGFTLTQRVLADTEFVEDFAAINDWNILKIISDSFGRGIDESVADIQAKIASLINCPADSPEHIQAEFEIWQAANPEQQIIALIPITEGLGSEEGFVKQLCQKWAVCKHFVYCFCGKESVNSLSEKHIFEIDEATEQHLIKVRYYYADFFNS